MRKTLLMICTVFVMVSCNGCTTVKPILIEDERILKVFSFNEQILLKAFQKVGANMFEIAIELNAYVDFVDSPTIEGFFDWTIIYVLYPNYYAPLSEARTNEEMKEWEYYRKLMNRKIGDDFFKLNQNDELFNRVRKNYNLLLNMENL